MMGVCEKSLIKNSWFREGQLEIMWLHCTHVVNNPQTSHSVKKLDIMFGNEINYLNVLSNCGKELYGCWFNLPKKCLRLWQFQYLRNCIFEQIWQFMHPILTFFYRRCTQRVKPQVSSTTGIIFLPMTKQCARLHVFYQ